MIHQQTLYFRAPAHKLLPFYSFSCFVFLIRQQDGHLPFRPCPARPWRTRCTAWTTEERLALRASVNKHLNCKRASFVSRVGRASPLSYSGRACASPCPSCCPPMSERGSARTRGPDYEAPSEEKTNKRVLRWRPIWFYARQRVLNAPCFCRSCPQRSSGDRRGTSGCENNDLEGLGSRTKKKKIFFKLSDPDDNRTTRSLVFLFIVYRFLQPPSYL